MGYSTKRMMLVDHTRAYTLTIESSAWWGLLTTRGGVTSRTW
jgi:hypothetical protein